MEYLNGKWLPKFGEQKEISSDQELEDYGTLIGKLVLTWDLKKIEDLIEYLEELNEVISTLDSEYSVHTDLDAYGVDMSSLPSADYPIWMDTVDFWAVDQKGMCLVGPEASGRESFRRFVNGVLFSELDEDLRANILAEDMFTVMYDTVIDVEGERFPNLDDILYKCFQKILTIRYKNAEIKAKYHQEDWTYQHPTNGSWEQEPKQILQGWSEQDPEEQIQWEKLVQFLEDPEMWDFMDQGDNEDTILCSDIAGERKFSFLEIKGVLRVSDREGNILDCEIIQQQQRGDAMVYLVHCDEIHGDLIVVEYPDGTQYTPWDWQDGYTKIPDDLGEVRWLRQDGTPGIMLNGLPRGS